MDKRKDLKFLFQLALEYRLSLTVLSSILYNDIKEEHKESILNECINICKEVSPNMVNACKYLFEVETVKDGVRYAVLSAVNDVYHVLGDNGNTYIYTGRNKLRKTGRHFPEIAAVLEKMRGETNE